MVDINVPTDGNGNNGDKPRDVNINVPKLNINFKTLPLKPSTPIFTKSPVILAPSSNQLQIDCCNCKGREFHLTVLPMNDGSGSIREIVCVTCNKVFKIDPNGARLRGDPSNREIK